jgi:hypothetical protein
VILAASRTPINGDVFGLSFEWRNYGAFGGGVADTGGLPAGFPALQDRPGRQQHQLRASWCASDIPVRRSNRLQARPRGSGQSRHRAYELKSGYGRTSDRHACALHAFVEPHGLVEGALVFDAETAGKRDGSASVETGVRSTSPTPNSQNSPFSPRAGDRSPAECGRPSALFTHALEVDGVEVHLDIGPVRAVEDPRQTSGRCDAPS